MRIVRAAGTLACCIVLVAPVAAAQAVLSPSQPAQQSGPELQALVTVRDSVTRVRNEVARFRRDLALAAGPTVVSRAGRLTGACEGLLTAFAGARPALTVPSGAPATRRAAAETLRAQISATQAVLRSECRTGLRTEGPGTWPDSLKAWGPHRASKIEESLVEYDQAATSFARALDLEYPPKPQ